MPAGATYKRLHDIIQNVTNFRCGYPYDGYHLFEFDLPEENRIVTDNEEAYLEQYKKIRYTYDFGDNWSFIITLEQIVDDYYFGFPTLLDGAETAPPEDVGGIHGFYHFLEIYRDPKHEEHDDTKIWAESMRFREYDAKWINDRLKSISYKKTEWDKINHERYVVINDKYRQ